MRNFFCKTKKFYILFFLFIILFFISYSHCNAHEIYSCPENNKTKNVLIVHSYNRTFKWTNDTTKGIESSIKNSYYSLNINHDYMDLNRMCNEEYFKTFYNMQKLKYENFKFDVIICCDNGAFRYFNQYGKNIFPNTPVIFCGINSINTQQIIENPLFKAVEENLNLEENLKIISKLQPNIKKIIFIGNSHLIGSNSSEHFNKIIAKYKSNFSFQFVKPITVQQLTDTLKNLNPKTTAVVFTLNPILDNLNRGTYLSNLTYDSFKNSKVPLYSFWDFDLNHGTIGGKLVNGFNEGKLAGNLALKILNDENINSIPNMNIHENEIIFDYNKLTSFNINLKNLPKNSKIINKPEPFYKTYKKLVIFIIVFISLLLLFIIILFFYVREKEKNRKKLNESYNKLSLVYEELLNTEDELRKQFYELQASEEKLRISEERHKLALEGSSDAIWEWNTKTDEFFISDKWTEISGYKICKNTKLKNISSDFILSEDKSKLISAFNNCTLKNSKLNNEFRIKTKSNKIKWLLIRGTFVSHSCCNPLKMCGSITDISQRKVEEQFIKQMAFYDPLTKLPNKHFFINKLKKEIKNSIKNNTQGAVLFIDLDNFKTINDTLGHYYGDELLKNFSFKINKLLDHKSIAARFGGDEFLILIPEIKNLKEVKLLYTNILDIFKNPFNLNNTKNYLTGSIGGAIFPKNGTNADIIFKSVDMAMYAAKQTGKNKFCFFNKQMSDKVLRAIKIEKNLRTALENNEFTIYYQPQISLSKDNLYGLEAILIWNNKELGIVSPKDFIPIAKETKLIIPIGKWLIKNVCTQCKLWLEKGYKFNSISVSITATQLSQDDFINIIKDNMKTMNILPNLLHIQISENSLMKSIYNNIAKLTELKKLGVGITLDNFGYGSSSLNYFKKIPLDTLKIHKSFINNICEDYEQNIITKEIIRLCNKLNYVIIADGIENSSQLETLKNMNCDIGQGSYFSKPISKENVEILLQNTL
ncbi:bifunctional diguanylate cyclase/phosphodiesterase [Clostridium niameyense]|uniref:bifunctional diguanylate cyclase/phosphodiesterase n=1 Tax=Clostridium niameyense TaxID=1622073 RepID=UPI00067EBC4B|nr:bifunctional diguanylate cyclase/phosphodiesterase [Clostridium niameyense]